MNAWAKRAAEEIVSDDAIDEAESDRTSTSDWMKWALAATALGAAGFAAWKYRPEIQQALESTKVYSDKDLSNRIVEKIPGVGSVTSSPAVLGAIAGVSGQLPGMPAAIREARGIGKDAPVRTIPGQLQLATTAGTPMSGSRNADLAASEFSERIRSGLGGAENVSALQKLYNAGAKGENSALGKLRSLDFSKLPADWGTHSGVALSTDTGLSRSRAVGDLDRISSNAVELDRRLGSNVDYKVPQLDAAGKPMLDAAGAPVYAPKSGILRDVPDTDRVHLAPEHRLVWDAYRQLLTESGAKPGEFRLGELGKGISTNRASVQRRGTIGHAVRGGGLGLIGGGALGTGIDLLGKAFE